MAFTLLLVVLAAAVVGAAVGGITHLAQSKNRDQTRMVSSEESTTTTSTDAVLAAELSDSDLVDRFGDAVWRVETEGCGYLGVGTAFAIAPEVLVTNQHVVATDTTPTLRDRSGNTRRGQVVGMTATPDIAVIKVDSPVDTTLSWADTSELTEGDHLLGLGYPVPDNDFTAAPGSILSFRVSEGRREAIRSDGAFDHGNSGGPAINSKGEVVGVITRMADRTGFQQVPLIFTPAVLKPVVDGFLDRHETVAADCSAVEPPPLPDWFEEIDWDDYYFDEFEPPPIELPDPLPPPTYSPPTTLPCPTGGPAAIVTAVDAVESDPQYLPGYYDVFVSGTLTNNASAPILTYGIEVEISGYGTTYGFIDSYDEIAPGASTTWTAQAWTESPSGPPSAAVRSVNWMWGFEYYHCD